MDAENTEEQTTEEGTDDSHQNIAESAKPRPLMITPLSQPARAPINRNETKPTSDIAKREGLGFRRQRTAYLPAGLVNWRRITTSAKR